MPVLAIATTNLFEVSSIPLTYDHKRIPTFEKVSPKDSSRQDFQEIPRPSSDATATKASIHHHVPPCLAQQLYQTTHLQPFKNYESVKEIKLQPRTKASPRAATFLKFTPRSDSFARVALQSAENSCVPDAGVFSAGNDSHPNQMLPPKMKTHRSSDLVLSASITKETFDIVSGNQQPQNNPHVSFVDIRFALLSPKIWIKNDFLLFFVRYVQLPFFYDRFRLDDQQQSLLVGVIHHKLLSMWQKAAVLTGYFLGCFFYVICRWQIATTGATGSIQTLTSLAHSGVSFMPLSRSCDLIMGSLLLL